MEKPYIIYDIDSNCISPRFHIVIEENRIAFLTKCGKWISKRESVKKVDIKTISIVPGETNHREDAFFCEHNKKDLMGCLCCYAEKKPKKASFNYREILTCINCENSEIQTSNSFPKIECLLRKKEVTLNGKCRKFRIKEGV